MRKVTIPLVILICAGVFLWYMGFFAKPEDRVNAFFNAYNRQDMEEMIKMVDNPEMDKVKHTLAFAGNISKALLGVNVSELLLDFLPISEDLLGVKGSRMYAEIQSSEMDTLRTKAEVYALVTTEFEQQKQVEKLVFQLKKKDRVWYITDIQAYQ